jgi:hypothetical protein
MNDPLLSSDGEEDPHDNDDDLCNWEYYTENFDTAEDDQASSSSDYRRTHSGQRNAANRDDALGGTVRVDSVTQVTSSNDDTSFPLHQTRDYYARAAAASTVPNTTPKDETQNMRSLMATPSSYDSAKTGFSKSDRTANEQYVGTPKNGTKSVLDSSGDDSLSPLPLLHSQMRCSRNHTQSSTATLPTAPAIFRPIYGDRIVPPLTFASLYEHGEAATTLSFTETCASVTHWSDSSWSLVRQQTQLCKPLTGYNYFYRDEKDNILQHLQQPGDPLPDPVCDFSAYKMEQLLHQHWYVFHHCFAICWNETPNLTTSAHQIHRYIDPTKGKRPHKKSHGKIPFQE